MVDFNRLLEEERAKAMATNSNPFGAPDAAEDSGAQGEQGEVNNDLFDVELPTEESGGKFNVKDDDYPAQLVDLFKDTSSAGNPMFVWEFELLWPDAVKGKTFRNFTALTPAAMWKLTEVLVALDLGKPGQKAKFKKEEAIGRYAIVSMVTQIYKGENRSSIGKISPMSEAQKQKLKELSASAGGPPIPGSEGTTKRSVDDDIPF